MTVPILYFVSLLLTVFLLVGAVIIVIALMIAVLAVTSAVLIGTVMHHAQNPGIDKLELVYSIAQNNAVAVIYSYLPNTINANITYIIFLAISLLCSIIGVLWFSKKNDENYEVEKSDSKLTEKQKYISLFTSWAIILFICLNIYEALNYFDFFKLTMQRIIESIGL